jgi:hypothetical protein
MQAYAAVKFADACLRGLRGDSGIVECAFVASQVCSSFDFSSSSSSFNFDFWQIQRTHALPVLGD